MNGTEQASGRQDLQTLIRREFARTCEDLGIAYTTIASRLGLGSSTVVERWAKLAPLPVWVLANPDAIPAPLYNRLIAVVEAQRTLRSAGMKSTAEGAAFSVLSEIGTAVAELSGMLADFKLAGDERPASRALAKRLFAKLEALVRAIDDADSADAGANVRQMRAAL